MKRCSIAALSKKSNLGLLSVLYIYSPFFPFPTSITTSSSQSFEMAVLPGTNFHPWLPIPPLRTIYIIPKAMEPMSVLTSVRTLSPRPCAIQNCLFGLFAFINSQVNPQYLNLTPHWLFRSGRSNLYYRDALIYHQ